jgi:hypothetical protein
MYISEGYNFARTFIPLTNQIFNLEPYKRENSRSNVQTGKISILESEKKPNLLQRVKKKQNKKQKKKNQKQNKTRL